VFCDCKFCGVGSGEGLEGIGRECSEVEVRRRRGTRRATRQCELAVVFSNIVMKQSSEI
jgi:hypothetical protein